MPARRIRGFAYLLGLMAVLAPASAVACTVNTVGVAFGRYDPDTGDDGVGTLTLSCPPNVHSPQVSLGTGSSGSYNPRAMVEGADRLNYNLFTDLARTAIWGDGTSGTTAVTMTGGTVTGGQRRFQRSIYGRIPASQRVRAKSYSDTMVITVSF